MDGLPNFITHGAPLARFARRSSAKNDLILVYPTVFWCLLVVSMNLMKILSNKLTLVIFFRPSFLDRPSPGHTDYPQSPEEPIEMFKLSICGHKRKGLPGPY